MVGDVRFLQLSGEEASKVAKKRVKEILHHDEVAATVMRVLAGALISVLLLHCAVAKYFICSIEL